ncbi:divergent PAP2 family protein [Candidatus Saccharibacteria bacterium]|nr:divergent PAP2 family protein [Candidatus Saccharibacteria bacterium]
MIHTNIWAALSPYMIAFVLAYLLAEGTKIIVMSVRTKKFYWRMLFKTGGMPSSHSAVVMALATVVGLLDGFGSSTFAIAAVLAAIVITDATHVRRSVGEQGKIIKKIIERDAKLEREVSDILGKKRVAAKLRKPYFSSGHRPLEALIGSALGVIVGVIVACLSVG